MSRAPSPPRPGRAAERPAAEQPAAEKPAPSAAQRRASLWLAVTAVLLAAISVASATEWARHRRGLLEIAQQAGLGDTPSMRSIEREITPHQADLLTARALVYHLLATPDGEKRRRLAAQLPAARELASGALSAQPNSWQAAMLLGMATYLERSIDRDERLYTESRDWEAPLEKAVRDASGHPEPRRLLATAYLETWHALAPAKRQRARQLIKQVFADDLRAFEALSPAWFELGQDLEQSLEIVPADPRAWQSLERSFADRRRWKAFIIAHGRRLDALEGELEAKREEAELRLRLGDYYDSRSMFLKVLQGAPPSRRFLPLVSRSLELYPPGLHGFKAVDSLEGWVDWALELARLDIETLPPQAAGRLLDALGEPEPETAARLALLADDPYQAQRFERLAQPLTLVSWAPYLVAKAKRQAAEGDGLGARESLAQVGLAARDELPFLIADRLASSAVGDLSAEAEARARLDAERRREWTVTEWRWRRGRPTLDMLPRGAAEGVEIEILEAASAGAVVELGWDGGVLARRTVRAGQTLRLDLPVDTRPHLLELRSLAGGTVVPGRVNLR